MTLLKQLLKFILVGSLAAATHMSVLYAIVTEYNIIPLIANLMAFLVAFNVSFFGHHYWTFSGMGSKPHFSVMRFFVVATSMMGLNEGLFYVFYQVFQIYYLFAIFLVLIIIPPLTFVLSRQWAFRGDGKRPIHSKKNLISEPSIIANIRNGNSESLS